MGVVLLTALLALPLTFCLSMNKGLSHDEHQHVAAGALFARESLLPYKDFPYFHTPHLVFVYGWLFGTGSYLLLKARAFSAVCAALTAGVLFATAWHGLRRWNSRARWVGSLAALALMLCSPLFQKASGQAGNHDPATLCALVSVVLLLLASETKRQALALLGSGLFLGLAAGFRITWAPIALPMLCVIAFGRQYERSRMIGLLTAFSAGALLGLAPLIWLFAIAPDQTIFNNFEFSRVNILYRFATGEPRTMTLLKKGRYFWKEVVRPEFPLATVLAICAFFWWRAKHRGGDRLWLTAFAAVLPFVFIGCFAPSPLFYQYFYALVPFVILIAVFAAAAIWNEAPALRSPAAILLVCVAMAVVLGARKFSSVAGLFSPADWTPIERHVEAQPLREKVLPGRVLTLAPLHALEAGFKIYPPFSTGSFAWRVAPYIAAERRHRLRIVSEAELESFLRDEPPTAIILGYEKEGEEALAAYATSHGFHPQAFGEDDATLWLRLPPP
jgi:4-amino-4-deoxy-L-arabinose transferase-like glycosyltransferase